MSFDYTELAQAASDLVADFGRDYVINRKARGEYDPAANARVDVYDSNYTVRGVLSDYRERQVDGESVLRGDKQFIFAALGLPIEPALTDVVVDGADAWRIVSLELTKPGSTALCYVAQVRR